MENVYLVKSVGYLALSTRSNVNIARTVTTSRVGWRAIVQMHVVYSTRSRIRGVLLVQDTSSSTLVSPILTDLLMDLLLGVKTFDA